MKTTTADRRLRRALRDLAMAMNYQQQAERMIRRAKRELRAALAAQKAVQVPEVPVSRVGTSLTFRDAIEMVKAGKGVRRAGWNGNTHVRLEDAAIYMFTAHGKHQAGWLADQPDILATDWQIVE